MAFVRLGMLPPASPPGPHDRVECVTPGSWSQGRGGSIRRRYAFCLRLWLASSPDRSSNHPGCLGSSAANANVGLSLAAP